MMLKSAEELARTTTFTAKEILAAEAQIRLVARAYGVSLPDAVLQQAIEAAIESATVSGWSLEGIATGMAKTLVKRLR